MVQLNRHPDISLMFEADVLKLHEVPYTGRLKADWATRLNFWNGALFRHGLDHEHLRKKGVRSADAAHEIYKRYCSFKGSRVGGEKAPSYAASANRLRSTFPGAKFIVIWRDPWEILSSMRRASVHDAFFRRRNMAIRLIGDLSALQREVNIMKRANAGVLEIHYDELIGHFADTLDKAFTFLGVPSVNLSDYKADLSSVPDGRHHERLFDNSVSKRTGSYVVKTDERRKIARYVCLWKKVYPDLLLAKRMPEIASDIRAVGAIEQFLDLLRYRALLLKGEFTLTLYEWLPIYLLKNYRLLRGRKIWPQVIE